MRVRGAGHRAWGRPGDWLTSLQDSSPEHISPQSSAGVPEEQATLDAALRDSDAELIESRARANEVVRNFMATLERYQKALEEREETYQGSRRHSRVPRWEAQRTEKPWPSCRRTTAIWRTIVTRWWRTGTA